MEYHNPTQAEKRIIKEDMERIDIFEDVKALSLAFNGNLIYYKSEAVNAIPNIKT